MPKKGWTRRVKIEDVPQLKTVSLQKLQPYKRGVVEWDHIASGEPVVSFKLEYETHPGYVSLRFNDFTQVIETAQTHGHLHQHITRTWFVCPGCSERKRALSIVAGYFMCAPCHGLIYRSQSAPKRTETTQHRRKVLSAAMASAAQTR